MIECPIGLTLNNHMFSAHFAQLWVSILTVYIMSLCINCLHCKHEFPWPRLRAALVCTWFALDDITYLFTPSFSFVTRLLEMKKTDLIFDLQIGLLLVFIDIILFSQVWIFSTPLVFSYVSLHYIFFPIVQNLFLSFLISTLLVPLS